MIVEINEIVNELVSLLESLDFLAVDTLRLSDLRMEKKFSARALS